MALQYQNEDLGKRCRLLAKEKGFTIKRRSEWAIDVYYTALTGERKKVTLARWEYVYDFITKW